MDPQWFDKIGETPGKGDTLPWHHTTQHSSRGVPTVNLGCRCPGVEDRGQWTRSLVSEPPRGPSDPSTHVSQVDIGLPVLPYPSGCVTSDLWGPPELQVAPVVRTGEGESDRSRFRPGQGQDGHTSPPRPVPLFPWGPSTDVMGRWGSDPTGPDPTGRPGRVP